jgi:hypothetical protein
MKIIEAEGGAKTNPASAAHVRSKKPANPNARSNAVGRISIVYRPVADLKLDPRNPRAHSFVLHDRLSISPQSPRSSPADDGDPPRVDYSPVPGENLSAPVRR